MFGKVCNQHHLQSRPTNPGDKSRMAPVITSIDGKLLYIQGQASAAPVGHYQVGQAAEALQGISFGSFPDLYRANGSTWLGCKEVKSLGSSP